MEVRGRGHAKIKKPTTSKSYRTYKYDTLVSGHLHNTGTKGLAISLG